MIIKYYEMHHPQNLFCLYSSKSRSSIKIQIKTNNESILCSIVLNCGFVIHDAAADAWFLVIR